MTDADFYKKLSSTSIERRIGVKFMVYSDRIIAEDEDFNRVEVQINSSELSKNVEILLQNYSKQLSKTGESEFYCTGVDFIDSDIKFLPISMINNLRRTLLQNLIIKRIQNYSILPQKPIKYAKFPYSKIDYKGNVFNSEAKDFYSNCNCKVCEDAVELKKVVSSGIELMRTKHCLRYALNLCSKTCKYNKKLFP